jgi:hypothetical protein
MYRPTLSGGEVALGSALIVHLVYTGISPMGILKERRE